MDSKPKPRTAALCRANANHEAVTTPLSNCTKEISMGGMVSNTKPSEHGAMLGIVVERGFHDAPMSLVAQGLQRTTRSD